MATLYIREIQIRVVTTEGDQQESASLLKERVLIDDWQLVVSRGTDSSNTELYNDSLRTVIWTIPG